MSITKAFRDTLQGNGPVAAIVGDRVRIEWPKSETYPYLTIINITNLPEHHMTAAAGLVFARLQIDCWTRSRMKTEALSTLVREALDGRPASAMGNDNLDVSSVHLVEGPSNEDSPPTDQSRVAVYRDRLDFTAWHAQSVPTFA